LLKLEAQKLRLFITYGRMGEYRRFVEVLRRLNSTEVAIPGRTPYEEVLKLHRIA